MIPQKAKILLIKLPGSPRIRFALLTMPVVLMLAGTPQSDADPARLQQSNSPGGSLTVTESGAKNAKPVAKPAEPATGTPASTPPAPETGGAAVNDGREDLTVFFSIGVVVDVLLVTAFLVWAVGQWRKTKK